MNNLDRTASTLLLVGGGLFTIWSQVVDKSQPLENPEKLYPWTILGLLAFICGAASLNQERVSSRLAKILAVPARWLGLQQWQVIALILAIPFSVLTHYAAGDAEKMNNPSVAWMSWICAIALVIMGSWKAGGFNFSLKHKAFLYALVFSIIALPIRSLWLNHIPVALSGDEGSAGIYAMAFLDGSVNNVFNTGWYSFPGLYFLNPALSIALFGNTTAALRLPSAIIGALTVGCTYLAGKTIFDQRTGILAAIMLAGFHVHVHFSRIGLNNIWDGLFFVCTVMTAWYAWEKENRNAAILTGVGIGLSQYFYPSTRVLAGVVLGGMILAGLFDRGRLKRMMANILLMVLVTLVIVIPLAWFYIKYPEQFLAPMQRVSIIGAWLENEILLTGLPAYQILAKQIWLGVQSFTILNLQHWYRPETSFLRPYAGGLFLLGLGYLVLRPQSSRTIMLLLWLLMYVLLGGLSESTPAAQRYVGAAPVGMLLVAHALGETANFIEKLWPRASRWVTVSIIAVSLFLVLDDMNFYFNRYTPSTVIDFEGGDTGKAQLFANYLLNKPEGTEVFFYHGPGMGYYSIPSIAYLAPQVQGFDVTEPWGSEGNPVPKSKNPIFIFVPATIDKLPTVQSAYPDGTLQEFKTRDNATMFWIYDTGA